jgi:hypothetical protein
LGLPSKVSLKGLICPATFKKEEKMKKFFGMLVLYIRNTLAFYAIEMALNNNDYITAAEIAKKAVDVNRAVGSKGLPNEALEFTALWISALKEIQK